MATGAWAKLHSQTIYELAGGSLLCNSSHARHVLLISFHFERALLRRSYAASPAGTF